MLENLKKLVSVMSEGTARTELEAEIKRLEEQSLISKPTNLAEMLKDEKFAEFKKEYDASLGAYRTKWETEQKDEAEKKRLKELAEGKTKEDKTEPDEFQSKIVEALEKVTNKLSGLETQRNIDELKKYADEKSKDLPEQFKSLITITEGTQQADVDKQIELLTTAKTSFLENIDDSPTLGTTKRNDNDISEWKEALPPIKEQEK